MRKIDESHRTFFIQFILYCSQVEIDIECRLNTN